MNYHTQNRWKKVYGTSGVITIRAFSAVFYSKYLQRRVRVSLHGVASKKQTAIFAL